MSNNIIIGIAVIAAGALCQSVSYAPIRRVKGWAWETYWLVQGVFAWIVFPLCGALMAMPEGHSLFEVYSQNYFCANLAVVFGALWGLGGLAYGLAMRYLGLALGQSVALGTCAGLGTIMGPLYFDICFPEDGLMLHVSLSIIFGVVLTLVGIALIGIADMLQNGLSSDEDMRNHVKDFNFPKGMAIALLSGAMSGCFNIALCFGHKLVIPGTVTSPLLELLPVILLTTFGGFLPSLAYCLYQNARHDTLGNYTSLTLWKRNIGLCTLSGLLWYLQFFALSVGIGIMIDDMTMVIYAFCILMSLNVVFANAWDLFSKYGSRHTTSPLNIIGIVLLVIAILLPAIIKV